MIEVHRDWAPRGADRFYNLAKNGYPSITTEIRTAPEFYYAEEYHQQYLAKNPAGYCGLGGTQVAYGYTGGQLNSLTVNGQPVDVALLESERGEITVRIVKSSLSR